MSENRASINSELRGPLLILLIAVPLLSVAAWRVHDGIVDASTFQRRIRVAQITRARVVRFALDEETGLRGYTSTGDPLFLEPYRKAESRLPSEFDRLRVAFAPLVVDDIEGVLDDERRQNQTWKATVAKPLLAHPERSAASLRLQLRGKQIMDTIRNDDQQLLTLLDNAAAVADRRSDAVVTETLVLSVIAVTFLSIGAALFGFFRARSAREAFQNRLLFENQKRIADQLQAAFLNADLPDVPAVGLHAAYVPASHEAKVGGDWYDAFELADGRILFSIGDVAGHGLEAAVVMSRARQAIIGAAMSERDPAMVLARANASIFLQEERMVTAICGFIDPSTLEITYATAGHPPPVLAHRDAPAEFLSFGGVPLGILPDATFRTFHARPRDGSLLVFYTDGVIEHNRDLVTGRARLLEAARLAVGNDSPAESIQREVFGSSVPSDDVAILTVSFKAPAGAATGSATLAGLAANRFGVVQHDAETPGLRGTTMPTRADDPIDSILRELLRSRC